MKEKKSVKELLKSVKEDAVSAFIEDKFSSEKFTDEQRGLIKGFLSDAVDVGVLRNWVGPERPVLVRSFFLE